MKIYICEINKSFYICTPLPEKYRTVKAEHYHAKVAQLVEHDLAKVGVASSNLVFRSKSFPLPERIFFDMPGRMV